jgi:hypothetical protein
MYGIVFVRRKASWTPDAQANGRVTAGGSVDVNQAGRFTGSLSVAAETTAERRVNGNVAAGKNRSNTDMGGIRASTYWDSSGCSLVLFVEQR